MYLSRIMLLWCYRRNTNIYLYMKKMIQKLQAKPTHIRERIAFGIALGVSGLLLIVWAMFSLSTSILGPKQSASAYFKADQKATLTVSTNQKSKPQGFLSAAANVLTGQKPQVSAHLEIVTVGSTSTVPTKPVERTVIPF